MDKSANVDSVKVTRKIPRSTSRKGRTVPPVVDPGGTAIEDAARGVLTMPSASTSAPPPPPESFARGAEITGVPVVLADGQTWLLARTGLAKGVSDLRESFYSACIMGHSIPVADILAAAWYSLGVNYLLEDATIEQLLLGTPAEDLLGPVIEAVVPLAQRHGLTFNQWARGALLSNGLKPSEIPPDDLPHVLAHLVQSGRAVAHDDYTDAGEASRKVGKIQRLSETIAAEARELSASPLLATE